MKRQDRQGVRTARELERKYNIGRIGADVKKANGEILKLADSITIKVDNGDTVAQIKLKVGDKEIPATIEMKGLVSFSDLKTAGQTEINGGNITTGSILADLIRAGVLKSRDEKSIILDLDNGRADITGSFNVSGENEAGYLIGSLRPGFLQLVQTDFSGGIVRQVQITERGLAFLDPVSGKTLALESEKSRLTGLEDPEDGSDAVSLSYLNRKLDELREELGLSVG